MQANLVLDPEVDRPKGSGTGLDAVLRWWEAGADAGQLRFDRYAVVAQPVKAEVLAFDKPLPWLSPAEAFVVVRLVNQHLPAGIRNKGAHHFGIVHATTGAVVYGLKAGHLLGDGVTAQKRAEQLEATSIDWFATDIATTIPRLRFPELITGQGAQPADTVGL